MVFRRFFLALLFVCSVGLESRGQTASPPLRGYIATHDPSTIIQCSNRYYMYYTGQNILSKSSSDRVFWTPGPAVFNSPPAWTSNAVPGFAGIFWAPDLLYFNGQYHLWYAVSTFGSQVSAIGLVTTPTLDPSNPAYLWTDQGLVINSTNGSPYNTIDPSFTYDGTGNLWMVFGSYWSGLYAVQLNATNGLRLAANSPVTPLAYNSSIEASYIFKRGGYYYLFCDWGQCCEGVNSTYNMRMGRSSSPTGPFLDQNGTNMLNEGGTLFQQATGKYIGPGHVGLLSMNGQQWFSYHYYDANAWAPQYNAYGSPDLNIVPLSWTTNDWPYYSNVWSASYRFQGDAREDNGQYTGLFENGTTTVPDATYGRVANLNGTNQYIWLPPGMAYAQTFTAVVKWRGGAEWQRIFDLGYDTTKTCLLTPASGNNVLRCDLNPGGNLQTVQWTQPLPTNVWTQVAVTFDGSRSILYVNGAGVATNASGTLLPSSVAMQTNHLGRSKFTADPYFNGEFASFRSYSQALTPAQIIQPLVEISQPANGSTYQPGQVLTLAAIASDFMAVPIPTNQLSWQIAYVQNGVSNVVFGPVSAPTNLIYTIPTNTMGGGIYIVTCTATDSSSRQSSSTATLSPGNPPAGWSSYFPLQANANDVNGNYNGTLQGGASFVTDPVRGNVLSLNGTNQYVSLPAGTSGMQTFMAWVKWNGGTAWQRIYDFGNDTNRYSVLTPSAANGLLRFNISVNSQAGEQIADAPAPFPTGVWTHVAVVMTGPSVFVYTNGVLVSSNLYADLVPANLNATNNYLGKSQWPTDPYFSGEMSDVRIFSRALASNEVIAPQITISQPAQGATYLPGATIAFAATANDYTDTPLSASNLTWNVYYVTNGVTNIFSGPFNNAASGSFAIPASGGGASNGFYTVSVVATDAAGRSETNFVSVYPLPVSTNWASFYPFKTGAQDSSNLYNGTLQGGAVVQNTLSHGNVLLLGGNGQYVSLPAAAGTAQTVSGWASWSGGAPWERIFDFGQGTNAFFYLTTCDGSNLVQCAITCDLNVYNQIIESSVPFPTNQLTQFAVVMDGREGILYLNGVAVGVNNSVNLLPSDVAPLHSYLGKSDYATDPYFAGSMSSFALNSAAISTPQLLAPVPVINSPTNGAFYSGGATIGYGGAATDFEGNALPAADFSWSAVFYSNGIATNAFGPITNVTSGSYQIPASGLSASNSYFLLTLTVTDSNGYQQSVSRQLLPVTSLLSLVTTPFAAPLTLDGQNFPQAVSTLEVVNESHTVSASPVASFLGSNYSFVLWSDGGAASHAISIPATNETLTASYIQPSLTYTFNQGQINILWPQWVPGGQIYTTSDLTSTNWTLLTNAISPSGTSWMLSLPVTNGTQFFRLQAP